MEKPLLYRALADQLGALIAGEPDRVANTANMAALVYHGLPELNWAGFYFARDGELVLGPFQGKPACVRIAWGKGVCGTAAAQGRAVVVPDVDAFPGHIACDAASRSELVVPLVVAGRVVGVFDLDSPYPAVLTTMTAPAASASLRSSWRVTRTGRKRPHWERSPILDLHCPPCCGTLPGAWIKVKRRDAVGIMIDFARPDGRTTKGYLANAGHGRPGLVVIQEWWGLNDQICGVADRFARAGYNALAPDLYEGRVTTTPDEANHLMSGLDFPDATHQDLRGAAQHLAGTSRKVAVMGFCMGGALTIAALVHVPEFAAGVCFYDIPPQEFADPAKLKAPFQGHFANQDDWCTPAAVDQLEAALKRAGAPHEIFRYDAAHAFFNERSPAYDLASADRAWERTASFLEKRLQA